MNSDDLEQKPTSQDEIKLKIKELFKYMQEDDVQGAKTLIQMLGEMKEDSLYQELGKLTRELHNTIKEIDVGLTVTDIPDARVGLNKVISLTEEAANKTMDYIDATIPLSNKLAGEAKTLCADWSRFKRREMKVDEFKNLYQTMMLFLEKVEKTATIIHDNLQEVVLAQNYQDLSGQTIKKVIAVIAEMENKLVRLVAIAAKANEKYAVGDIESPELKVAQIPEVTPVTQEVQGQDEVDDLLSSLGF